MLHVNFFLQPATFVALQVARKIASCNMVFSLREISFVVYVHAHLRVTMTRKSCAVGMRNVIQGNHRKMFADELRAIVQREEILFRASESSCPSVWVFLILRYFFLF